MPSKAVVKGKAHIENGVQKHVPHKFALANPTNTSFDAVAQQYIELHLQYAILMGSKQRTKMWKNILSPCL